MENNNPIFTKEMKKTHTILLPNMLPIHFSFMKKILNEYGYKAELLKNEGSTVVEEGLKNVHNDTCYPALLVIGQMIDALKSGKYDVNKVALLITQTGGGCRASNYIFLLRKALKKSGFGNVPVISLNLKGLDKNSGFKITLPLGVRMLYCVILGDFLMLLKNQCLPYEINKGDTLRVVEECQQMLLGILKNSLSYKKVKCLYKDIINKFNNIPQNRIEKVKVGIVGEIYVKYSYMANNHLEDFLVEEDCEVVVPGLMNFCFYCLYNQINDINLYGGNKLKLLIVKKIYKIALKVQMDMINAIKNYSDFNYPMSFDKVCSLASNYINQGVKMGEGWLLTVEMAELIKENVNNIICTQPFGCLPNHIVGKGMMNYIKAVHPNANIVAIDYDPGASKVNQQNRIKLMLANAKEMRDIDGK